MTNAILRGALRMVVLLCLPAGISCRQAQQEADVADSTATDTVSLAAGLFADSAWKAPDTASLPHDAYGQLVRYGRDLIARTGYYFGPKGILRQGGNGMNCQNCHLDAGTRLYGNSFSAVCSNYPKFRARSGSVEHLDKRINDCMQRSMNGEPIDSASREMKAMMAYINWVGKDVPKGTTPKGASIEDLPFLDRPADIARGKVAFMKNCTTCHGADGAGKLNADGRTYEYPPLWGPFSYNNAAGLYRITRLAGFIKNNMPNLKTSHAQPVLTTEEAWDIAAFICSQPRTERTFSEDWPDRSKMPVDMPFGPYSDSFGEYQHKYGPFAPIVAAHKK
jgi:thiosulfate dehydrogenase